MIPFGIIVMKSLFSLVSVTGSLTLKGLCRERKFIAAINCLHKFFDHLRTKCFVS